MKKFIALLMALVMALSLTTVAWGAGPWDVNGTGYATLSEALTAAGDGGTITLTDNTTGAGAVIDQDVTIDLGGYTYTINSAVGSSGTETLGLQLIKDNDITLMNGTITSTQDVVSGSNQIQVLVMNYSNLTLDEVYLNGTQLTGVKYVASFNNGTAEIVDTYIEAPADGVAFDTFDSSFYTGIPTVIVEGDSVVDGKVEAAGGELEIEDGTFNDEIVATNAAAAALITVEGGTFAAELPEGAVLGDGLAAVLVNGEYVIQEPADVSVNKSSSNVDTEDWVAVDLTTGTAYDIAEDAEVKKIVYKDIKKTVNGVTTTQYGVTLYGPLTFEGAGAAANDGYAVVVAKESANMQLETAAGKIIFARFITADEYAVYSANEAQYAYTTLVASEFVEEADDPSNCEDPFLSYYVVGDYYYVVSDSNADNTLIRYKNEFVIVGQKLDFEPLVPHTFMYDEDACKWSSKDNELVSVKCTCGDTFKIVQDIRGLKAGSYYSLGTGDFVILKSTSSGKLPSSSSTTSSNTVTSAPTFDAGIALYVGMSIAAAAGGAVVIGKKKD